jgi:hypothetical protein
MMHCVTGCSAALHNYLGHTVTGMSYLASSMQLTLHLQSQSATAAAQQAAEQAAAAVEATVTWQGASWIKRSAYASCWAVYALSPIKHSSHTFNNPSLVHGVAACCHNT